MWFERDDDEIDMSGNVTPPLQEDLDVDDNMYKGSPFPKSLTEKGKLVQAY